MGPLQTLKRESQYECECCGATSDASQECCGGQMKKNGAISLAHRDYEREYESQASYI